MLAQSVYAHTSSCGGSGVLVVHCLRAGGLATVLLTACWNSTFKDPLMDLVLGGVDLSPNLGGQCYKLYRRSRCFFIHVHLFVL